MADETEEVDIVTVADNAVKNENLPTNDENSSQIEDEDENIDVIGDIQLNGERRIEDSRELKYSIINAATICEDMPQSPQPGPSGIGNKVEGDSDEDSDDSVKIIEVPKKPIPLILISDSSSGSEIDVITTVPKKQQRNKKKPFKSVKEKLEEQKSKLFPMDTKSEKDMDKSPNKHDLTCSICLGTYKDRAFLEKCFHSFCFTCILQWSKVVHTCPLCKTPFQSLIHNITPDLQYHQYFVGDAEKRTLSQSLPTFVTDDLFEVGPRFRYHSTQISRGNHANVWYRQNRQDIMRNHQPRRRSRNHWGQQSTTWSHIAASEQRRWAIYQNGMVIEEVKHPPGRVRYRDTSVEFFQYNPAIAHRLVPWILRDLKVILQRESDSSLVLHLILSLLQRYPMESDEFYNQLLPYLQNNTRQFIRELISFASSPYDMRTYDSRVVHVSSTAQPAPSPTTAALEEPVGESQSSNNETSRRENANSLCRPTSQEELTHRPNNFVSNAACSAYKNAVDGTVRTSKRKEYKEKRSATLHHSILDSSSGDEISPRFARKHYPRHRSRENRSRSRSRSRHRDDEQISSQKSNDRNGKYHRKHSRSSSKTDGEYTKRSARSSRSRSKERKRSARPLRSEREYIERRDDRRRNRSRSMDSSASIKIRSDSSGSKNRRGKRTSRSRSRERGRKRVNKDQEKDSRRRSRSRKSRSRKSRSGSRVPENSNALFSDVSGFHDKNTMEANHEKNATKAIFITINNGNDHDRTLSSSSPVNLTSQAVSTSVRSKVVKIKRKPKKGYSQQVANPLGSEAENHCHSDPVRSANTDIIEVAVCRYTDRRIKAFHTGSSSRGGLMSEPVDHLEKETFNLDAKVADANTVSEQVNTMKDAEEHLPEAGFEIRVEEASKGPKSKRRVFYSDPKNGNVNDFGESKNKGKDNEVCESKNKGKDNEVTVIEVDLETGGGNTGFELQKNKSNPDVKDTCSYQVSEPESKEVGFRESNTEPVLKNGKIATGTKPEIQSDLNLDGRYGSRNDSDEPEDREKMIQDIVFETVTRKKVSCEVSFDLDLKDSGINTVDDPESNEKELDEIVQKNVTMNYAEGMKNGFGLQSKMGDRDFETSSRNYDNELTSELYIESEGSVHLDEKLDRKQAQETESQEPPVSGTLSPTIPVYNTSANSDPVKSTNDTEPQASGTDFDRKANANSKVEIVY